MSATNRNPSALTSSFGPWLLLGVAIAGEIAGALLLRVSDGFTRPLPTISAIASFGIALFLVSRVMKALPVSIAYPVWAGVALLGLLLFGESVTALKLVGVGIVGGDALSDEDAAARRQRDGAARARL